MTEKTYPDQTVETAAREAGANVIVAWEMEGPKNSDVAWMTCLVIGATVVIVQTFETGGWEAYVPASDSCRRDVTIDAVLRRCGVIKAPSPEMTDLIAKLEPIQDRLAKTGCYVDTIRDAYHMLGQITGRTLEDAEGTS
ncbi:MAG: hypothetical protein JJ902_05345 [Roseibium sp.]|nr:hypothetical protein [Roseibium sp.]